jgi:hypothetical protein
MHILIFVVVVGNFAKYSTLAKIERRRKEFILFSIECNENFRFMNSFTVLNEKDNSLVP